MPKAMGYGITIPMLLLEIALALMTKNLLMPLYRFGETVKENGN